MFRLTASAIVCVALFVNSSFAADRYQTSKLSSTVQNVEPIVNFTQPHIVYELRIAEPVPDLLYQLEFRYLETRYQEGSEWIQFGSAENEEDLNDSIVWIALHLVAEWRIVEVSPQPQWELVSTHTSYTSAVNAAQVWESIGMWTWIMTRYTSLPQAKTPVLLQSTR